MSVRAPLQSTEIDFSELHAHHSRAELKVFKRWARSTSEGSYGIGETLRAAVVVLVVGSSLLLIAVFTVGIVFTIFAKVDSPAGWGALLVIVCFVTLSVIRLTDIWRRDVRSGPRWRRWMQLDRFTLANQMIYAPRIHEPQYEGTVFTVGHGRRAYDVVATTSGRYVEAGNYEYRGDSGLDRSLNRCGYVRIEADRRMPHLYLRSRGRGKFSRTLGATFARAQEFSLEGDFGKHFRLYAPGGYERDALYIFTPDVMAALIDHAAGYDVEFVDDYIYFYSGRRFNMRSQQPYAEIARLVDSVVNKVLRQANAYSDFRSVGNFVTSQGARLQGGITFAAVVGALIVLGQILRLTHVF